ncbi:hypothetical protein HHK36_004347 [Tetracentron sinense]|uniref:Uncharacterized protein n=1 Tax=Tetracentron sinense TaxID=13715 RepID=A0A834ZV35_TETSI|nr:hypothetical protein HHK36_004347 [Tetracentron sinense]
MPRTLSRSPSYRRKHSPSPVGHRAIAFIREGAEEVKSDLSDELESVFRLQREVLWVSGALLVCIGNALGYVSMQFYSSGARVGHGSAQGKKVESRLSSEILKAMEKAGSRRPSPIQMAVILLGLQQCDAYLKEDTAIVQLVIFDDPIGASFIYCSPVLKLIYLDLESVRKKLAISLSNSVLLMSGFKEAFWNHKRQREAELKLLEEETAKRMEEAIRKNVEERLDSEEIKLEIQRRIEEGRKKLLDEVAVQLEKEKEAALIEARQKEEQAQKEREELDKMLEENQRRVEEAQRREALEQQRKEEERYRELEQIQRQKEEAMWRKKQEEEEERANQMKLLGKNKSRPKLSFGLGLK